MISIVIPTRNRGESLERCLKSIRENTRDFEVIVIEREGGFNEKFNEGIRKAKGEYVAMLHDDVEVHPGWCDVLADAGALTVWEPGFNKWIWGGYVSGALHDSPQGHPEYSGFLVLSRKALEAVMPLDEAYQEPGYQDVDLGLSLRDAGYEITCLPGMITHHHLRTQPITNREYFNQKWGTNA